MCMSLRVVGLCARLVPHPTWTCSCLPANMRTLRKCGREILDHLRAEGFDYEEQDEAREFVGYDGLIGIGKVAKVDGPGKPIHVLVANTSSPHAVLESFDLSTSMVGITKTGYVVKLENYWTPPFEEPIIIKDTPTTAAREAKIHGPVSHQKGEARNGEISF